MNTEIFKVVGQVAGIGGIALIVFLLLFREVIRRKGLFPRLRPGEASGIIRLFLILAWSVAIGGLVAWVWAQQHQGGPPVPIPLGVIRIIHPAHEEFVNRTTEVEWETSYPDKNHFILASWEEAPTPILQDPTLVTHDSTWKGFARLGEAGDPPGTKFYLQILATRSRLREGPLAVRPPDAIYSDRITVAVR